MKRFAKGDLVITCNTRWPQVNDGHLVLVTGVIGPMPEFGLRFAYQVERVDGGSLVILKRNGLPGLARPGTVVCADQSKLRPLRDRPVGAGVRGRDDVHA